MTQKEQEEFNNKVVDLLDHIVHLLTRDDSMRQPERTDLYMQVAMLRGLIEP